ncbi:MAG: RNA-binding S4 domain-containing protein [Bacillota bacterium]|nr:RNA-binding S4 domain-containing protein [Bacillota bacterium]
MRLDKYLKVSRIIKRRTVAKEVCEAGRISVNGHRAKAGSEIKTGDILRIAYGGRLIEARVEKLAESMRSELAAEMYTILSEQRIEQEPEPEPENDLGRT